MKKLLSLTFTIIALFALSSCTATPSYQETIIAETYEWNGETSVVLEATYPIFEDERYESLNTAIENEVQEWRELYESICASAAVDCEKDSDFAKLKRYVSTKYSVSATRNEISVTFDVQYFNGGNSEPSYTKIFTLDLENDIVYQTYTETKRIYP